MASPHDAQRPLDTEQEVTSESSPLLPSQTLAPSTKGRRTGRGSLVAITVLIVLVLAALVLGFIIPNAAKSYVENALQINIDEVRLLDIKDQGIDTQIYARISLNASKAQDLHSQRLLTNFLLRTVGPITIKDSVVDTYLEHEGWQWIAHSKLTPISIRLVDDHVNFLNLTAASELRNTQFLGSFLAQVVDGSVHQVKIKAVVNTRLVRFFSMRRTLEQYIDYTIPSQVAEVPPYNLTNLKVSDIEGSGIAGSASMRLDVRSPISATVPPLAFDISIKGCSGDTVVIAQASNEFFELDSKLPNVSVDGLAQCKYIPKEALQTCKDTKQSPLDRLMQGYISGNSTTVIVSGSAASSAGGMNSWIQDMLHQISIPVEIPGNSNDQLARDIELLDVKFNLPSLIGGGSDKPKISGKIRGTIDIPKDIHVGIDVQSVHILADLIYKGKKFAYLESPGWAPATSDVPAAGELLVQVMLKEAPVTITNQDVFSTIISKLFGGKVLVDVLGNADVKVNTALGKLEAHRLPIEANDIEIGGLGFLDNVTPRILDLGVLSSSRNALDIGAVAEIDNPTHYEANISYADVLMSYNNYSLGHVTLENAHVVKGTNTIRARLRYAPTLFEHDSVENSRAGNAMLSSYLSEVATNITAQAHPLSLPDYPNLSSALAYGPVKFDIPIPRLVPSDEDTAIAKPDTGGQFLVSARFHVFSSTASFVLRNPLNTSITITSLTAKARYHDDVIGTMDYGYPIILASKTDTPDRRGETETTKIPVRWSLPASDILRRVIGGTLVVNATANATVQVGEFEGLHLSLALHDVSAGVGL